LGIKHPACFAGMACWRTQGQLLATVPMRPHARAAVSVHRLLLQMTQRPRRQRRLSWLTRPTQPPCS
jgi:hypothetical protein